MAMWIKPPECLQFVKPSCKLAQKAHIHCLFHHPCTNMPSTNSCTGCTCVL